MKIKHLILIIAILTVSACAQVARSEQLTNASASAGPVAATAVTQAEATNKIEAICVRNCEETQLLINMFQ